jgi:hypothetical protein
LLPSRSTSRLVIIIVFDSPISNQVDEHVDSLNSAKEKLKQHETFYDEYDQSKNRLKEVQDIAKEIAALGDAEVRTVDCYPRLIWR